MTLRENPHTSQGNFPSIRRLYVEWRRKREDLEFDSLTQNMPDYKMVAIPTNEEVETIIMD